ncbi:MAG: hypothetical protein SFV22_01665 [Saprospiraceae bacterium]|nr:hypothetical protein [Saprospiraceae bacterium]
MKRLFLFPLLLCLLAGACRSLRVGDFHSSQGLGAKLPGLGLLVHERSFLEAFDAALFRDVVINSTMSGPGMPAPWVAYDVTDQALKDVFHALDNELSDHFNLSSQPRYGHARFKLLYYKRRNSGWGWTVASVSTLFVPNLFGMPVRTHRAEIELQMEIVDAQGNILKRYTAPGTGKARVAAYHGYDTSTATRKANLVALQNAMAGIKKKMEPDVPMIGAQLESAGTIKKEDGK